MSAQALILSGHDRRDEFRRWSLAAAIVVAAHLGLVATYLLLPKPLPQGSSFPPAITIDLAPAPVSPSVTDDDQSGPQMSEEVPQPPEVMPKVEPQPEPLPKIEAPAEIVLPEPKPVEQKPEVKPEQKKVEMPKVERKPPTKRATAARSEQHTAEQAAAPLAGAEASRAIATWRDQVYARLQAAKRCPGGASGTGSPLISFTVDRGGSVIAKSVVRGSGNSAFDQEALAMVGRAQPFPPVPVAQAVPLRLPVPINFTCR